MQDAGGVTLESKQFSNISFLASYIGA